MGLFGASKWPEYDEVKKTPTEKRPYYRVLLVTKAPNGRTIAVAKNAGNYKDAHADAYSSLVERVRQNTPKDKR